MSYQVQQIGPNELALFRKLMQLFADGFDDAESYLQKQPSAAYVENLLSGEAFLAVVATSQDEVIGGLAAYELQKFEQERSEIYLYDLAVDEDYRRRGVATALIEKLRQIAKARGASLVFVQADTDESDQPAIALYTKLGKRRDVLQFDIDVD